MKRKVIKQGHNTLTVTLPSSWVKKYGISVGDELEITEQEKNIVVSTQKGPSLSTVTIDISGLTPSVIWRYIISAYRAGYDEIRVVGIGKSRENIHSAFSHKTQYDKVSPTDAIRLAVSSTMRTSFGSGIMNPIEVVSTCVDRLIGLEIIDQKEDYCVLKDINETSYKEFDNALRRIFLLIDLEAEYVMNALNGKRDEIKSIMTVDTNLDRFEDFCIRVLSKKGYVQFRKTPEIFSTIFLLEAVGDELKKIGLHVLKDEKKYSKFVIRLFEVQLEQLKRFYNLFYKFDKSRILEIYEEDKKGSDVIDKYYPKLSKDEIELLHHFKKIGIFVLNLTELRIDLEF